MIVGKYDKEEECWCSQEGMASFGIGLWKAIRKGRYVCTTTMEKFE